MSNGAWIGLDAAKARIVFNDVARDNLTITDGDLLFSADNTWDIGATGATRPRTIYAGTSVIVGNTTTLTTDTLTGSGALNLTSQLAAGQTTNSAFNFTSSNDLGASDELLQIGDSAATFLTVLGNGNVGIGTTNPQAQLEIYSNASNYSRISSPTWLLQSDNSSVTPLTINLTGVANGIADFQDGGTSVLYIKNGGNVGIGTTGPDQALDVIGTIQASNLLGGALNITTDANGNIIRDPSDRRLKENIQPIENALDKVMRLRGVTYNWKDRQKMGSQTDYGMIAQEVAAVTPELTATSTDGVMGVKYTNMVGLLANAVQEQQTEISNAKVQISNQAQSLNDQSIGMDDKLKIISGSLSAIDQRLSDGSVAFSNIKIRLDAAEAKLKEQENNLAAFEASTNELFNSLIETDQLLTDRIANLEEKIATLTVSGGGEIPANVVTSDTQGNVTLAGILSAKEVNAEKGTFKGVLTTDELVAKKVSSDGVVAGAFAVKNDATGTKNDTIGSGKILEVKKDEDKDEIDDETGSDGKSTVVKNSTVKKDSKIFVTSRTMLDQPLVVTKIKDGESFTVEKKSPTNQDIEFDWWIIESR